MRYERSARLASLIAIAILAALTLASSVAAGATTANDHYLCYTARKARPPRGAAAFPRFEPRAGVTVTDALSSALPNDQHLVDLTKSTTLCVPANKNGEGIVDTETHLEGYKAKRTRTRPNQPRFAKRALQVENQLGHFEMLLNAAHDLLVPSAAVDGSGGAAALDTTDVGHFRCYKARLARRPRGAPGPAPTPRAISVTDAFGERLFNLQKPTRVCLPANKNDEDPDAPNTPGTLLCYAAKLARTSPRQARFQSRLVSTHNQFGDEVLKLAKEFEFCVPSLDPAATPSPTPIASPGPSGTAVGPTSTAGATVTPTTTVTPAPLGTPAVTLERISLRPPEIARLPGEAKHFFATGHYSDGSTAEISDQLVYTSSDTAVGIAPNDPTDRNRIDILAQGTTMITARDPASGVSTANSGDDAQLIATGPLQSIEITTSPPRLFPGESKQFTAVGTYAPDGVTRGLTQDVVWGTTDPSIAVATNPEGNRSRIDAVGAGTTQVTAVEPNSGIAALITPSVLVFGPLDAIFLDLVEPNDRVTIRAPGTGHMRAIGRYQGGGFADVTDEVVFASNAPGIVTTPNDPNDPGLLDVIGGGTAQISATHVATGLIAPPHNVRGLHGLQRIFFGLRTSMIEVGQRARYSMIGLFGDGSAALEPADILLESSDPAIADVDPDTDGLDLIGVGGGHVIVVATDRRTGISTDDSGDNLTLGVRGPLQRISLTPDTTRRLPGQVARFLGLAHYEGGFTEVATQDLTYTSSNPAVAVAPNAFRDASRIEAVGPGTTMITATNSAGLSTTDTGDDAVLTVLDTLESVRIAQAGKVRDPGRPTYFTAVGRDVNGAEINLTQDVVWSSSDLAVATAPNPIGERSLILPATPGVALISVTEPLSGLTSTAAGADAILVVLGALQRLIITPNPFELTPGQEYELTVRGEHAGGGTTNLTQDVDYLSDDPGVVEATNLDGHRSHIVAHSAGSAIISVVDPLTGISSSDSGDDATMTVTDP